MGKNYYHGSKVWELIDDMDLNFNRGNIVKYICRAGRKPEVSELEDLRKARDYIDREIEKIENRK